jgi:predicted transcriptional regulator
MTTPQFSVDTWKQHVVNKIKEIRRQQNLTPIGLSEKAGLPLDYVFRLEALQLSPTRKCLQKLCTALDIELSQIDPSSN